MRTFILWDSEHRQKIEVEATHLSGSEWKARCIRPELHKNMDAHPSLRINEVKGTFFCDVCKISGWLYNPEFAKNNSNHKKPLLDIKPISSDLDRWLKTEGKSTPKAFEHFGIGEGELNGERCLIIPLGNCQKLYFWNRPDKHKRWKHYPNGKGVLAGNLSGSEVIITAGEWDFFSLWERGFKNIITSTTGEGNFPEDKLSLINGKNVTLAYDNDGAGKAATERMAKKLDGIANSVKSIDWLDTGLQETEDVRDFFVK